MTPHFLRSLLASGLVSFILAVPATAWTAPSAQARSGWFSKPAATPAAPSSSTRKPGFFGGLGRTQTTTRRPAKGATYPIVQQRGDTTIVQVNGAQRPAVIRHSVLAASGASATRVMVDLTAQRAYLLVNGQIGIDTPVSTARAGKFTPTGEWSITERVRSGKISTIYHVAMPNWMRLGGTTFGMHAGFVPGYPASAGCVRLPAPVAAEMFNHTRSGTRVAIRHSLAGMLPQDANSRRGWLNAAVSPLAGDWQG
jgi:lipoprotein-anchoring transpeptidase ErfK/SrfK